MHDMTVGALFSKGRRVRLGVFLQVGVSIKKHCVPGGSLFR